MAAPTKEDAQLLIQLAQWGTSLGVQEAMPHLLADDFDPDAPDGMENPHVRTILMYGETIGTLTKHGLISSELITDWLWVAGMWSRVGPSALHAREQAGEPRLYENFEALASG